LLRLSPKRRCSWSSPPVTKSAPLQLLTLARRHGRRLVTFDAATLTHDGGVGDIELLTSL
jgi:hypothetical protein